MGREGGRVTRRSGGGGRGGVEGVEGGEGWVVRTEDWEGWWYVEVGKGREGKGRLGRL